MTKRNERVWDLIVVGSGPNGLAVALHARKRGLEVLIIERGHLAENIARFPKQLVFFVPAMYMEIAALPCDALRTYPTREEMLSYLGRIARLTGLTLCERTEFCSLEGADGDFRVLAERGGERVSFRAKKLVLATGVFGSPNRLTVPGAELAKVTYGYDDPYAYRRQRVVIVGAGSGAAEAALRLCNEADAEVTVLNRAPELRPARWRWRLPDVSELIEHGQIRLVHNVVLERIEDTHVVFSNPHGRERIPNDHVIVLIGYNPDSRVFDAAGVNYGDTCLPDIDPRTLESNVKGVYVAGHAVTGLGEAILIRTSRNHGKAIVGHILGDAEPVVQDLGVGNAAHWQQFAPLDDPLDAGIALELVPVVVGEFQHQLIDVFQPVVNRHYATLQEQGVPLDQIARHPFERRPTVDELAEEHVKLHEDGSITFKGQHFPGAALDILRLADGNRRIRDIAAEVCARYASKKQRLPEQMVVDFLLDLMRIGKLTWRPAPVTAPRRSV